MAIIDGKHYTNHEAHKLLWEWLAKNPDKDKQDFFKTYCKREILPKNFCYACEEALGRCKVSSTKGSMCTKCPIKKWREYSHYTIGCACINAPDNLYSDWSLTDPYGEENLKKLNQLAAEIADLEWIEEEENE